MSAPTPAQDGGPIHPIPEVRDADGNGIMEGWPGMSLRDWLAGMEKAPEDLSVGYAEALAGRPHPHKNTTLGAVDPDATVAVIEFWADAEARYRYIKADAMLRARALAKGPSHV
jgi:hypothetical protein